MKIVAGSLKNRSIFVPKEGSFRPTLARTRAMVFNICQMDIEGASFLDLFAATGAMGFEAISRGASEAVFIDNAPPLIQAIKQTSLLLDVQDKVHAYCRDVPQALEHLIQRKKSFDIIFMDPPYYKKGQNKLFQPVQQSLELIDASQLLKEHGSLFIEDSKISPIDSLPFASLVLKSKRTCGDAFLWQFLKTT